MAGFDDLYRMQQGRNNPLINVQQMQGRLPNWLSAPAPQNNNVAATQVFANTMQNIGRAGREQQELDIKRQQASDLVDIQMRTFQAEQANLAQKRQARENYAAENPSFAGAIMAGKEPTTFQRQMALVGNDLAKHREVFGPGAGVTVNAGNQYATPPKGMVRVPDEESPTGTKLVPEAGAPEKKISDAAQKNLSIAEQNETLGMELENALTNPDGSPNQRAIASMKVPGTTLNKMLNLFSQNETYLKSGAAAGETETATTKGAIEPSIMELMIGEDPLSGIRRSTEYARQRVGGGNGKTTVINGVEIEEVP